MVHIEDQYSYVLLAIHRVLLTVVRLFELAETQRRQGKAISKTGDQLQTWTRTWSLP